MSTITLSVLQGLAASRLWLRGRVHSERGASAVEYGLLVALIALVIIGAVYALGGSLSSLFSKTSTTISTYA